MCKHLLLVCVARVLTGATQLYTYGHSTPELMARVSRGRGIVTLEMSTRALQVGLMEVATLATVLMLSGRPLN